MKRYVVRKYVMAENPAEAYKLERNYQPEDVWLDEKQPEPPTDQIGFDFQGSGYSYSPVMKRKKKRTKRK